MKVFAIESSCDETSIAIIDDKKNILSHIIVSQIDIHKEFGGVVPEIASRNHLDIMDQLLLKSLDNSNLNFNDIDYFCATTGPGLIGGLIVGAITAQTIASIYNKPFIPINHLEGHILINRFINDIEFPFLSLLLSGGHTQLLLVKNIGEYEKLGETIDDSLGECFDKVAQMLGLEYPGGPKIEKLALLGNKDKYKFVKPLIDSVGSGRNKKHNLDFSFSGLKTAIRRKIETLTNNDFTENSYKLLSQNELADISASFQKTVVDILKDRCLSTIKYIKEKNINVKTLVIAGGVSANQYIKNEMLNFCSNYDIQVVSPPIKLCTDNAIMIAWACIEKIKSNKYTIADILDIKSRWEL